ncbi:hypothetical protein QBC34DRAFT_313410, partial [Podospora aff. communis PSN243]
MFSAKLLALVGALSLQAATALPTTPCGKWECQAKAEAVPVCARPCIYDAAAKVGCDNTDYACRCQKQKEISNLATLCVISGVCSEADVLKTLTSTGELCTCVA